jgi:hypothetical protein
MGGPVGGGGGGGGGRDTASMPGAQTQQIFIPNALVGASTSPPTLSSVQEMADQQ